MIIKSRIKKQALKDDKAKYEVSIVQRRQKILQYDITLIMTLECKQDRQKSDSDSEQFGVADRDLFTTVSPSWSHSTMGGGWAENWQWNTASSFLNTT